MLVPDVSLFDEDSGVVDGSGQIFFEDEGLQSPVHEPLEGESQDVIELVFAFLVEQAVLEPKSYCGKKVYIRFMRAEPSKSLLGSFSSRVSSSLAALRKWASVIWTLQTSLLFFSPYLPMIYISWSRRSFS